MTYYAVSNSHSRRRRRAGIRNPQSLVKGIVIDGCTGCMAALAAWLHWLAHSSGSCSISRESRFDPRRPAAADRRASGRWHCLAIPLAGGWPAVEAAGGRPAAGSPALSSGVSEPAATVARTALAVITVTVAIVVVEGSAVTTTITGRMEAFARCPPAFSAV